MESLPSILTILNLIFCETESILLGLIFLYWAVVMLRNKDKDAGIKTFRYSITYLTLLFIVMLADHYLFQI
mgnify:CR=1 FL=1